MKTDPGLIFMTCDSNHQTIFQTVSPQEAFARRLRGELSVADNPQWRGLWWLCDTPQELTQLVHLTTSPGDCTLTQ